MEVDQLNDIQNRLLSFLDELTKRFPNEKESAKRVREISLLKTLDWKSISEKVLIMLARNALDEALYEQFNKFAPKKFVITSPQQLIATTDGAKLLESTSLIYQNLCRCFNVIGIPIIQCQEFLLTLSNPLTSPFFPWLMALNVRLLTCFALLQTVVPQTTKSSKFTAFAQKWKNLESDGSEKWVECLKDFTELMIVDFFVESNKSESSKLDESTGEEDMRTDDKRSENGDNEGINQNEKEEISSGSSAVTEMKVDTPVTEMNADEKTESKVVSPSVRMLLALLGDQASPSMYGILPVTCRVEVLLWLVQGVVDLASSTQHVTVPTFFNPGVFRITMNSLVARKDQRQVFSAVSNSSQSFPNQNHAVQQQQPQQHVQQHPFMASTSPAPSSAPLISAPSGEQQQSRSGSSSPSSVFSFTSSNKELGSMNPKSSSTATPHTFGKQAPSSSAATTKIVHTNSTSPTSLTPLDGRKRTRSAAVSHTILSPGPSFQFNPTTSHSAMGTSHHNNHAFGGHPGRNVLSQNGMNNMGMNGLSSPTSSVVSATSNSTPGSQSSTRKRPIHTTVSSLAPSVKHLCISSPPPTTMRRTKGQHFSPAMSREAVAIDINADGSHTHHQQQQHINPSTFSTPVHSYMSGQNLSSIQSAYSTSSLAMSVTPIATVVRNSTTPTNPSISTGSSPNKGQHQHQHQHQQHHHNYQNHNALSSMGGDLRKMNAATTPTSLGAVGAVSSTPQSYNQHNHHHQQQQQQHQQSHNQQGNGGTQQQGGGIVSPFKKGGGSRISTESENDSGIPSLIDVSDAAYKLHWGLDLSPSGNLRKGKWSSEEEAYANHVIICFKKGVMPLRDGVTLRGHLAKRLNCDPMRITKKYAGVAAIGKQVYRGLPTTHPFDAQSYIQMRNLQSAFLQSISNSLKRKRTHNMRRGVVASASVSNFKTVNKNGAMTPSPPTNVRSRTKTSTRLSQLPRSVSMQSLKRKRSEVSGSVMGKSNNKKINKEFNLDASTRDAISGLRSLNSVENLVLLSRNHSYQSLKSAQRTIRRSDPSPFTNQQATSTDKNRLSQTVMHHEGNMNAEFPDLEEPALKRLKPQTSHSTTSSHSRSPYHKQTLQQQQQQHNSPLNNTYNQQVIENSDEEDDDDDNGFFFDEPAEESPQTHPITSQSSSLTSNSPPSFHLGSSQKTGTSQIVGSQEQTASEDSSLLLGFFQSVHHQSQSNLRSMEENMQQ